LRNISSVGVQTVSNLLKSVTPGDIKYLSRSPDVKPDRAIVYFSNEEDAYKVYEDFKNSPNPSTKLKVSYR
jgi:hypothetical protein